MNDLDRLLNEPKCPNVTEAIIPKLIEKPTAAANKALGLADQDHILAAASAGSSVFKSAKDYLAASREVRIQT